MAQSMKFENRYLVLKVSRFSKLWVIHRGLIVEASNPKSLECLHPLSRLSLCLISSHIQSHFPNLSINLVSRSHPLSPFSPSSPLSLPSVSCAASPHILSSSPRNGRI